MADAAVDGPGISVLVPSYNAGPFFREAIESVIHQMRADDELLIQDGGTTDGSLAEIEAEYAAFPQLKVVSGPDGGQSDALNLALARAVNPVVAWLNADDCICPGALDAVRQGWLDHPEVDVIWGSWQVIDGPGNILRHKTPTGFSLNSLMVRPTVFSGAVFMRADAIRNCGGFDVGLYYGMDGDLWMRLAERGTAAGVATTLAAFRWHTASKTGTANYAMWREGVMFRRRYAHGVQGHLLSYVAAAGGAAWMLSTPLRMSKWFSTVRVKLRGAI